MLDARQYALNSVYGLKGSCKITQPITQFYVPPYITQFYKAYKLKK